MAIGALTEEIAENFEEVAEVTRKLDSKAIGFLLGGVGIGVAVGFFLGYRFNREKLREEAFEASKEEVAKIRETYMQKMLVADKQSLEEVIEERGYSVKAEERPLPAPVPIIGEPRLILELDAPEIIEETVSHSHGTWNYPKELQNRSPDHPYIIHQDEFNANEMDYDQTTYTYYSKDDVLCDTDEKPLPHADIVVGQENLKFGHGSNDENVVFIRNDRLTLEIEITRSSGSYEEEVIGLEHSDTDRGHRDYRKRSSKKQDR